MTDHPFTARPTRAATVALAAAVLSAGGCRHHYRPAPEDHTDVALRPVQVVDQPIQPGQPGQPAAPRPLPPGADPRGALSSASNDPALSRQPLPGEARYLAAYAAVGSPRLVLFVNRTVTGELIPPTSGASAVSPAVADDRTVTYLKPGQYDDSAAAAIDYQALEAQLGDDLSAGGKVTLIRADAARQQLTDADVQELQAGRPQMLGQLLAKLHADVLVQVTAHPSEQTPDGLGVRLVARATKTKDGVAVGFAFVDVPPPLTKPMLNRYGRFVGQKLIDGMSTAWEDYQRKMSPAEARIILGTPTAGTPGATAAPPQQLPSATVPPPTVPPPVVTAPPPLPTASPDTTLSPATPAPRPSNPADLPPP